MGIRNAGIAHLWLGLQLGLLVYARYTLLGVLLVSRYLAWTWIGHLSASRQCDQDAVQIGESATMTVTVLNSGRLRVPWLLLEDSLPLEALRQHPPRLQLNGKTLLLTQMPVGSEIDKFRDAREVNLASAELEPCCQERMRCVRLTPNA